MQREYSEPNIFPYAVIAVLMVCNGTSIPSPDVCKQVRPDRNASLLVPSQCTPEVKVRRSFFHQRRSVCKNFGICPEAAVLLDSEEFAGTINYFRNVQECRDTCINGETIAVTYLADLIENDIYIYRAISALFLTPSPLSPLPLSLCVIL